MPAIARIDELADEFKAIRHYFHQHPELSCQEFETAEKIAQYLESWGIEVHRQFGGTGLVGVLKNGDSSKSVALRADMDALAVLEANEFEHASKNKGVMHACGHDIHTSILFGVLQELNRERNFEGTLFGIFQPGEELNPGGASLVLKEEPFEGYDVAAIIGQHVDARFEVGDIAICPGVFMASNDELRFYVRGKGGHAARR